MRCMDHQKLKACRTGWSSTAVATNVPAFEQQFAKRGWMTYNTMASVKCHSFVHGCRFSWLTTLTMTRTHFRFGNMSAPATVCRFDVSHNFIESLPTGDIAIGCAGCILAYARKCFCINIGSKVEVLPASRTFETK